MKKRLYTNADLFYIILNQLKEKGLLPSILDYSLGSTDITKVKDIEWDAIGRITFGGSEGIYLSIYMEGVVSEAYDKVLLGTFKTLETSKEAYKAMSDLNVEFIFALRDFVDENPESFCWRGYNIKFFTNGKSHGAIWAGNKEQAIKAMKRQLSYNKAEYAILTNNETNTTETYRKEDLSDGD